MVESLAGHEAESRELFGVSMREPPDSGGGLLGDGGRRLLVYHGLVAAFCVVVVFLSVAMRSTGDQHVFLPGMSIPLPELCMTKTVLGIPCPGCGMTRGFISIAHGQWTRAWAFNPVSFLVFALVVGADPMAFCPGDANPQKTNRTECQCFFRSRIGHGRAALCTVAHQDGDLRTLTFQDSRSSVHEVIQ